MHEYCLARNGFELEFLAKHVEDGGNTCARIQGEVERPFIVYSCLNDDDPAVIEPVRRRRERSVQIELGGTTGQREDRGQREQASPARSQ